jgi:hypothetical protein
VSARTRRKFSAFLVRGKDGKVGFEFEAKAPKAGLRRGRRCHRQLVKVVDLGIGGAEEDLGVVQGALAHDVRRTV